MTVAEAPVSNPVDATRNTTRLASKRRRKNNHKEIVAPTEATTHPSPALLAQTARSLNNVEEPRVRILDTVSSRRNASESNPTLRTIQKIIRRVRSFLASQAAWGDPTRTTSGLHAFRARSELLSIITAYRERRAMEV